MVVGFDKVVLGSKLALGGIFGRIWCAKELCSVGTRIKASYDRYNGREPVAVDGLCR